MTMIVRRWARVVSFNASHNAGSLYRMKNPIVFVAGGFFLALISSPSLVLADTPAGELLVSTIGSVTYDSRVDGGFDTSDDYIFSLQPLVHYRRDAAQIKLDAEAGVRFNRYVDHTQYDSDDIVSHVDLIFPPELGPRISGNLGFSYDENTTVNYDVNQRLHSKTLIAKARAVFVTGLKTDLTFDGIYTRMNRDTYGVLDHRNANLAFNYKDFLWRSDFSLQYRRLEARTERTLNNAEIDQSSDTITAVFSRPIYDEVKGSISYGYRFLHRATDETASHERQDNGSVLTLGLRGPFLPHVLFPKLDSILTVSYQKAETPGVNDTSGRRITGHLGLIWHAREMTTVSLRFDRSMQLSVNNFTTDTTRTYLDLEQKIGHFISGTASVGYEYNQYRPSLRNDDVYVVSIGGRYQATKAWRLGANYLFRDSQSSSYFSNYSRHVVSAYAAYTF